MQTETFAERGMFVPNPEQLRVVRSIATRAHHPRLLLDAADRDSVRARSTDGLGKALAERLRMKCEAYLDPKSGHHLNLDAYDSQALFARPGQFVLGRIMMELGFGGWLWEEARYTEAAKRIVLRRAREAFQTQAGDNPDDSHCRSPLAIGTTGGALAWTADLLQPVLSRAEWTEVVNHIREYYLAYARRPFFERDRLYGVGFNKTLYGMCAVGQLTLLVAEDLSDEELTWGLGESLRSAWGYCREAMDDDGGTYEGPGYGAVCVGYAIQLAEMLRRHGLPSFSQYEPLHRHGRWLASIMAPGGGTISLGDSFGARNISPAVLLLAGWTRDPGLQWIYLRGLGRPDHPEGPYGDSFQLWESVLPQQLMWHDPQLAAAPPDSLGWPEAYHARGSDFVSLRSGWGEKDLLATVLGAGRRASASSHLGAEVGAIDLWSFGRELLHDPGYGFSTSDAHSTVQVSCVKAEFHGGNARFGAHVIRFARGKFASLTAVEMSQMLDCRWAFREVVLVQGARPYLIVADDLNYRSGWAEYDWFWQVPPGAEGFSPQENQPARIRNGEALLEIHCHAPLADVYPKPYQCAWHLETFKPLSWCGVDKDLTRLRMHMEGYNGCLLTVLAPRRDGAVAPRVTSVPVLKPGVAVSVEWEDTVDWIVFQPTSRFLQTDLLSGAGRLAVVREKAGRVDGFLLDEGYELRWRGQQLIPTRPRMGEVIVP